MLTWRTAEPPLDPLKDCGVKRLLVEFSIETSSEFFFYSTITPQKVHMNMWKIMLEAGAFVSFEKQNARVRPELLLIVIFSLLI